MNYEENGQYAAIDAVVRLHGEIKQLKENNNILIKALESICKDYKPPTPSRHGIIVKSSGDAYYKIARKALEQTREVE